MGLPRLILPSSMAPTTHTPTLVSTVDMPDTDTLTMVSTTARGPLMLSPLPMLMPTTATTAMVPGPTTAMVWDTEDTTVWATGDTSGDKFSPEVESRSSKRTSLLVI